MRRLSLLAFALAWVMAGGQIPQAGAAVFDSDNDGVPDELDLCPYSPAGAWIDGDGCAQDQDRDGVADGIDRCPDTPAAQRADEQGCSTGQIAADTPHPPAPADAASAMTLDDLPEARNTDLQAEPLPPAFAAEGHAPVALPSPPKPARPPALEPLTGEPATPPAETAAAVPQPRAVSAPLPDADASVRRVGVPSVPAAKSQQPEVTAASAAAVATVAAKVPEAPAETREVAPPAAPERPVQGLYFAARQAELDRRLVGQLRQWIDGVKPMLEADPRLQLGVSGHGDVTHDGMDAIRISARRAQAVREQLLLHGIPAHRVRMRVAGVIEPRFSGLDLSRNSRVELRLIEAPVQSPYSAPATAAAVTPARRAKVAAPVAVTVPFARHSAQLDANGRRALDRAFEALLGPLRTDPRTRLRVRGFAAPGEPVRLAAALASDRADAVQAYLLGRGLTASRIDAAGSSLQRGAAAELTISP